jgi:hypothetical protein
VARQETFTKKRGNVSAKSFEIALSSMTGNGLKRILGGCTIFLIATSFLFVGLLTDRLMEMSERGLAWADLGEEPRLTITLMIVGVIFSFVGYLVSFVMYSVISKNTHAATADVAPGDRRAKLERIMKEQLAAVRKRLIEENDRP